MGCSYPMTGLFMPADISHCCSSEHAGYADNDRCTKKTLPTDQGRVVHARWQVSVTVARPNMQIMLIRIAAHRTLPTDQGRVVHARWLSYMERPWLNFWNLFLHSCHHDSFLLFLPSPCISLSIQATELCIYLVIYLQLPSKKQLHIAHASSLPRGLTPSLHFVCISDTFLWNTTVCYKYTALPTGRRKYQKKKKTLMRTIQCTTENNIGTTKQSAITWHTPAHIRSWFLIY